VIGLGSQENWKSEKEEKKGEFQAEFGEKKTELREIRGNSGEKKDEPREK
jgi:hypothetical protein